MEFGREKVFEREILGSWVTAQAGLPAPVDPPSLIFLLNRPFRTKLNLLED